MGNPEKKKTGRPLSSVWEKLKKPGDRIELIGPDVVKRANIMSNGRRHHGVILRSRTTFAGTVEIVVTGLVE
jgi:hypothetical protein